MTHRALVDDDGETIVDVLTLRVTALFEGLTDDERHGWPGHATSGVVDDAVALCRWAEAVLADPDVDPLVAAVLQRDCAGLEARIDTIARRTRRLRRRALARARVLERAGQLAAAAALRRLADRLDHRLADLADARRALRRVHRAAEPARVAMPPPACPSSARVVAQPALCHAPPRRPAPAHPSTTAA